MCKCNTSWTLVQIATLAAVTFNAQEQKSCLATAIPKLPSTFVDGKATTLLHTSLATPNTHFPGTCAASKKKIGASHSPQAQVTWMSTYTSQFPSKAEDCRVRECQISVLKFLRLLSLLCDPLRTNLDKV